MKIRLLAVCSVVLMVAASAPVSVRAEQGMMGDQKGGSGMMTMMQDMSKTMGTMSGTMTQGKMDAEAMKKMGGQMKQMSEMMSSMSGMMGPGMMHMMMNDDMKKKMDEMRKQMDAMMK